MNSNNENYKQEYYDEYEIDLREYILLIWDHKWFITAFVVLAVLAAFVFSSYFIEPVYKVESTVRFANTEGIYSETESMNQFIQSEEITDPVLNRMDLPQSFFKSLETEIISELKLTEQGMQGAVHGGIIKITAEADDAENLHQAVENILVDFKDQSDNYYDGVLNDKEEQLSELKEQLRRSEQKSEKIEDMLNEIDDFNIDQAYLFTSLNDQLSRLENSRREYKREIQSLEREINDHRNFQILNKPYTPENPISPNIKLNTAIAAVLAFMLAVFIIFFKEFMKEDE
ncbi:MAG: YveK family protein [Halanaerobium sp.]